MNQFSEMSVEKLHQQAKTIKVATGTLAGMLLVLLVMAIFLSIKKGFSALVVIPFALLPIVVINVNSLKQIKKELESRGEAIS
jgi:cobalamin biosynthesis protein CobD/CbiB